VTDDDDDDDDADYDDVGSSSNKSSRWNLFSSERNTLWNV